MFGLKAGCANSSILRPMILSVGRPNILLAPTLASAISPFIVSDQDRRCRTEYDSAEQQMKQCGAILGKPAAPLIYVRPAEYKTLQSSFAPSITDAANASPQSARTQV